MNDELFGAYLHDELFKKISLDDDKLFHDTESINNQIESDLEVQRAQPFTYDFVEELENLNALDESQSVSLNDADAFEKFISNYLNEISQQQNYQAAQNFEEEIFNNCNLENEPLISQEPQQLASLPPFHEPKSLQHNKNVILHRIIKKSPGPGRHRKELHKFQEDYEKAKKIKAESKVPEGLEEKIEEEILKKGNNLSSKKHRSKKHSELLKTSDELEDLLLENQRLKAIYKNYKEENKAMYKKLKILIK